MKQATRCIRLCYLLLVLLAGQAVWAVPPPVDTTIAAQAHVSFVDVTSHLNVGLDSNIVRAIVQAQRGVQLEGNTSIVLPPGAMGSFSHTITNTGNVACTYLLQATNLAGNGFNLNSLTLFIDRNNNGYLDAGDQVLLPGAGLTLAAGESAQLVITGVTPSAVAQGAVAKVCLQAATADNLVSASAQDTVTVQNAVAVQILNAASQINTQPGQQVTYTVVANNLGAVAAQPIPITVDGHATALVLLQLPIPLNTRFATASIYGNGTLLYHYASDLPTVYHATPPGAASAATVDAVAYGTTTLLEQGAEKFNVTVTVNAGASGTIPSTATLLYTDPIQAGPAQAVSNNVVVQLPQGAPILHYYTDNTYTTIANQMTLGTPLYIKISAAQFNVDPTKIDTLQVQITSTLTGDAEVFIATETGPNTGEFVITPAPLTQNAASDPAHPGDGILQTVANDTLVASIAGYNGGQISATIMVDPFGTVFDTLSNQPVAGAVVRLTDVAGHGNGGVAGGAASVFNANGTAAPSVITTGANGQFQFPLVQPSTYRLDITPPPGYLFPSKLPPALQPPGRVIDPSASYHGTFLVTAANSPIRVDIPVDFVPTSTLFVEKTASAVTADIGDDVTYTLVVKNNTGGRVTGVTLLDTLPLGLWYVSGSTRGATGAVLPDPQGGRGPRISFAVGAIESNQQFTLTYRAHLGPNVVAGDVVNRAQATGTLLLTTVASNLATATVTVQSGVFTEDGILFGKVYFDENRNGVQDVEEVGVPGIRLYLDDGTYVITDSEGKFSLYGVSPRLHVLKLDRTTLPAGAMIATISNRQAGDAGSCFVDMTRGEMHKTNFALYGSEAVEAEIIARRTHADTTHVETDNRLKTGLPTSASANVVSDPRSLPASGLVDGASVPSVPPVAPAAPPVSTPVSAATPVAASHPLLSTLSDGVLAAYLHTLTNTVGIVNLQDGEILSDTQTTIQVKGLRGARFALTVNGVAVPETAVGMKASDASAKLQVWEYIGVALQPGANSVEIAQLDDFGNPHGAQRITVRVPGRLAKILLSVPAKRLAADGQTPVPVHIALFDAQGCPIGMRTRVTLDAGLCLWQSVSADPHAPGMQLFVEGGQADCLLLSPTSAGDCVITATCGTIQGSTTCAFQPDLRPMIAVGGLQTTLNLRSLQFGAVAPSGRNDGFDESLLQFAAAGTHENLDTQASLFMKGAIGNNSLLTLSYDSTKEENAPLFGDIQPDQFYPVYGDSSVKGFDAQSTSPLFVMIEQGKSYARFGDFTTASTNPDVSLGGYSRSLTGLQDHYETNTVQVNSFASDTAQTQCVDELPALGISGPYYVKTAPFVENSEQVEILVRDRNQPALIISTQPKQRFSDYTINPTNGMLLFNAPMPCLTPEMNPISIRVTYEVATDGKHYVVAGVNGEVKLTHQLAVGGSFVEDDNPQDQANLSSVNADYHFSTRTQLLAELARTWSQSLGSGYGDHEEFKHQGGGWQLDAYRGNTDINFNNPTAMMSSGQQEIGVKGSVTLGAQTQVQTDYVHSKDLLTGGALDSVQVDIAHTFPNKLALEVGIHHANETDAPADPSAAGATPINFTSGRIKVTTPLPWVPKAHVFTEYEQDISNAAKQDLTVGGDYQISPVSRIYARHEYISSLTGPDALNTTQTQYSTLVGIDTACMDTAHLFSEYRVQDALDGREAEAAMGLRNQWTLAPGVHVNASYEQLQALSASTANSASTALTGGLDYTRNPLWKGTTRIELRKSSTTDSILHTLGIAYKINRNWTFLGRNLLDITAAEASGAQDALEEHLQFGMAYRPVDRDRWNGLFRYEYIFNKNMDPTITNQDEGDHVISGDLNFQPKRAWTYTVHYAAKITAPNSDTSYAFTQLLSGRVMHDITDRWDAGLLASIMADQWGENRQTGLGAEVGYLIQANLYLSSGYNIFGFSDKYLSDEDYTDQGAYLRLRVKFDEDLFAGHNPQVNTTLPAR